MSLTSPSSRSGTFATSFLLPLRLKQLELFDLGFGYFNPVFGKSASKLSSSFPALRIGAMEARGCSDCWASWVAFGIIYSGSISSSIEEIGDSSAWSSSLIFFMEFFMSPFYSFSLTLFCFFNSLFTRELLLQQIVKQGQILTPAKTSESQQVNLPFGECLFIISVLKECLAIGRRATPAHMIRSSKTPPIVPNTSITPSDFL